MGAKNIKQGKIRRRRMTGWGIIQEPTFPGMRREPHPRKQHNNQSMPVARESSKRLFVARMRNAGRTGDGDENNPNGTTKEKKGKNTTFAFLVRAMCCLLPRVVLGTVIFYFFFPFFLVWSRLDFFWFILILKGAEGAKKKRNNNPSMPCLLGIMRKREGGRGTTVLCHLLHFHTHTPLLVRRKEPTISTNKTKESKGRGHRINIVDEISFFFSFFHEGSESGPMLIVRQSPRGKKRLSRYHGNTTRGCVCVCVCLYVCMQ